MTEQKQITPIDEDDPMSLGMSLATMTALAAFWAAEVAIGLTIGAGEMVTRPPSVKHADRYAAVG